MTILDDFSIKGWPIICHLLSFVNSYLNIFFVCVVLDFKSCEFLDVIFTWNEKDMHPRVKDTAIRISNHLYN